MKIRLSVGILLLVMALNACTNQPVSPAEPPSADEDNVTQAEDTNAGAPTQLKVAVLPILDALPMHVAQEEGYFEHYNLDVELVPISSAPERDQLMAAGQIDGMINETVSVIFYNQQETRVKIVRFARTATTDAALFSILASAGERRHHSRRTGWRGDRRFRRHRDRICHRPSAAARWFDAR